MPVDNSFAEKMAEKEQPRRKRGILRRLILAALCLLSLVIVVLACLVTFAPDLFSPLLLGGIRKQGLDVEAVEIRKIGLGQTILVLTGLNLGKIHACTLPVRLDYELSELIKSKRVRSIDIHHAVLSCNLEPGSGKESFDFKALPELLFQSYPDDLPFEKVSIKDASMEFHLGPNRHQKQNSRV